MRATDWNQGFMAVRGNEIDPATAAGRSVAGNTTTNTLVDLPGHPTNAQLAAYETSGY